MSRQINWRWAVQTSHGVYDGTMETELEEKDTIEDVVKATMLAAMKSIAEEYPQEKILSCFVSDTNLYFYTPLAHENVDINIEKYYKVSDLEK